MISCIIIAGMTALAQVSTLLEKGKSGIGIKGIYETSSSHYGFGGKIGGSVIGKVDIDLVYRYSFGDQAKNNLLKADATSAYYEGRLTWWFIRKEVIPSFDVNFGVLTSVDYSPFKNYMYAGGTDGKDTYSEYYLDGQIGLVSSVVFQVEKNWFIEPAFSIQYEFGKIQESVQNEKRNSSSTGVTSKIGLSIMKRFTTGSAIYLTTEQYMDTYGPYPFYQFSLGYILPL